MHRLTLNRIADITAHSNHDGNRQSNIVKRGQEMLGEADDSSRACWKTMAQRHQGIREGTTVAVSEREKNTFAKEALKNFEHSLKMLGTFLFFFLLCYMVTNPPT